MRPVTTIAGGLAGDTSWKMAERRVSPDLAPYVLGLYGYRERTAGWLRRRELPAPQTVVILQFGPPIRVSGPTQRWERSPSSFVAGLDEHFTLTEYQTEQRGLELKLSPIGARCLFGIPMQELTGRVVAWEAVMPGARGLPLRLAECRSWDARFDLIEALLRDRLALVADPRTQLVSWAYQRMQACGGALDVAMLAHELGYSHKHMIALFRDHVGVTPKRTARLMRFDRLVAELRAGSPSWAQLAGQLGFADQAHLAREVRSFSGLTPTALARLLGTPIVAEPPA